jgi:hypothetical protein
MLLPRERYVVASGLAQGFVVAFGISAQGFVVALALAQDLSLPLH